MGGMDVQRFHLNLLGHHQGRTPAQFWLNETHKALYTAYPDDLHGFSGSVLDEERFLATLVLALAITEIIYPVYFAVPKPHVRWVVNQIEQIGRYIFRTRKGNKDGVLALRQAFQQLRVTYQILELAEPPERWVMFGFTNEDILPPWAKGHLLEHGELAKPLTGASKD